MSEPHLQTSEQREGVLRDLERWSRTPMLVLSGVWLLVLLIELTRGTSRLLETVGVAVWIVFILEFALRLALAHGKLGFLGRNWLTVLSLVVPAFRLLRVFRALRVLRLARAARGVTLVRLVGGANRGMNALRRSLKRRGACYVAALTVVVALAGAAGMQAFEATGPAASAFGGFPDALWWTAMIMTTMGSEAWPQTAEGRLLCLLLSLYAFAVFGYITATLASFFVDRDREQAEAPLATDLAALRAEIAALRAELATRG